MVLLKPEKLKYISFFHCQGVYDLQMKVYLIIWLDVSAIEMGDKSHARGIQREDHEIRGLEKLEIETSDKEWTHKGDKKKRRLELLMKLWRM